MCIYATCVTLQKVCLLARQDAQCRVGTTPNMTADQMVEHVLGTMKKEPAAHAEKAVGPMEPADGEQKAVKKVVLKRPSAAAPTQGAGCSSGFPKCCPGVPTKKADPMRINGWTIYTDLNARAWRCKHPTSRCDKAASWKADVRVAWEKVQQIVNTEL